MWRTLYNARLITSNHIRRWCPRHPDSPHRRLETPRPAVPIEVDREARQRTVVEAAVDLIVEGGLEAVSFRNLARRLGCSTTSISHWFSDKSDVLMATYHYAATRAARRRDDAYTAHRDPVSALEEILPIGDDQRRDWIVWMCFWTSALHDPTLAQEQAARSRRTREGIEQRLIAAGHPADAARGAAQQILTTIYGIAVQAVFDPAGWPPDVQRAALRAELGRMAPRSS